MITYPTGQKVPRAWAFAVTDAANAVRQTGAARGLMRDFGSLGSGVEPLPPNNRDRRGASAPDLGCYRLVTETVGEGTAAHVVTRFANQYFQLGSRLFGTAIDTTVEELLPLVDAAKAGGEADTETGELPLYVALKLDATTGNGQSAEPDGESDGESSDESSEESSEESGGESEELPAIVAYPCLTGTGSLSEAQADVTRHVLPIYKFMVRVTEPEDPEDPSAEPTYSYRIVCDFRRGVVAQQVEII